MASSEPASVTSTAEFEGEWLNVGYVFFDNHKDSNGEKLRDDLAPITLSWQWTAEGPIRPCVWGYTPGPSRVSDRRRTFVDASFDTSAGWWQYDLHTDASIWETKDTQWQLDDWGHRVAALSAPSAVPSGHGGAAIFLDAEPHNRDWLRTNGSARRERQSPASQT